MHTHTKKKKKYCTARAVLVLNGVQDNRVLNWLRYNRTTQPVADLGDGMGGCIPPTSLKVTILAEKSASISNNSAPFWDASPPTDLNVTNPAKDHSQFWWRPFFLETTWFWAKKTFEYPTSAEKSLSILVKTFFFFFFFFWRPPDFGRKNVWISDFGQRITLNFDEDIRNFEVLCFKSPPTKIFWIRHWTQP